MNIIWSTVSLHRSNLRNKAEIIVGLGNTCNYDCKYCLPHSKSRTAALDNSQGHVCLAIKRSIEHFQKHSGLAHFGIVFVGGEPTVHPDFISILDGIQDLKNQSVTIQVITNLSRSTKWWNKVTPKITSIWASYHAQYTSHTEFAIKLANILDDNPHVVATIGLQPLPGTLDKTFDECLVMRDIVVERIGPNRLDFLPQHLYMDKTHLYPYTEDDMRGFDRIIGEFNNESFPHVEKIQAQADFLSHSFGEKNEFLGMDCYAGVESITIGFRGQVMRTSRCNVSNNLLGTIYEGFELPTNPIRCDSSSGCGSCWFDYAVSKSIKPATN